MGIHRLFHFDVVVFPVPSSRFGCVHLYSIFPGFFTGYRGDFSVLCPYRHQCGDVHGLDAHHRNPLMLHLIWRFRYGFEPSGCVLPFQYPDIPVQAITHILCYSSIGSFELFLTDHMLRSTMNEDLVVFCAAWIFFTRLLSYLSSTMGKCGEDDLSKMGGFPVIFTHVQLRQIQWRSVGIKM